MKLLKSSFWLHSIFYTLLQRFSLFFFGAVSFMVLVRGFGKQTNGVETYGVWALFLTILALFETIKQGLLRNPTIKFLGQSEYADKKREVQSSAMLINIFCTLLAILLFTLGGSWLGHLLKSPDLVSLLDWSVSFLILLIPYNHYEVLLQAHYQFSKNFWAYFVRQGIFFLGVILLSFVWPQYLNLINLLYLQVGALAVGTAILFVSTAPYRLKGFHFNVGIMRDMFHFGKYIFGTNVFSNIARSFDHFITASVLNPAEGKTYVSYYNTVARINNMIDVPSLAAADVLFPKNVETLETDGLGKVKYYFERMMGTILALVVPMSIFIFVFPKLIITILAPNFMEAVPILQLTILFGLVRPLGYQFGNTLDAIGKPNVNFYVSVALMLVNLVATFWCLSRFQGMGAAYATIIYNVISAIVLISVLKKYVHIEVGNIFKYMFQAYKDLFGFARKKLLKTSGS
ncbi:oligosaccharide flippase family protein [Paraflavitalea sp. CAU 1676]|uniref:oligosaccharide flippase family protein n=1 Tax=Paraflavitalea sp. CAU 1676 TaxID=3032598 RepID=UPI0023DAE53F|nr:oligosaccharide flippase family protein [Paraflavitalea sp. CAU 1676]MDF2188936.1 oligosaccharide flippase family protein [Paraflavitalea sp. CAU 1676]